MECLSGVTHLGVGLSFCSKGLTLSVPQGLKLPMWAPHTFQMQILLPSSNVCFSPHDPFVRSKDILRLSLCLTGAQSLLHAVTFPWAAVPWDVGRGSSAPGGGEGPGHSYILWGTIAIDKLAEAKLRLYYDVVSPCLEL